LSCEQEAYESLRSMTPQPFALVKQRAFLEPVLKTINRSIYQDSLETNIGNAEGKRGVFCRARSSRRSGSSSLSSRRALQTTYVWTSATSVGSPRR
jgi:hypothetical protein